MKLYLRIWLICLFLAFILFSQNVIAQVVIGKNKEPDVDAVLELVSTDKGLLLPRVQLTALDKPDPLSEHKAGVVVYNIGDFVPIPPEEEPEGSGVSPNNPGKATTDDPVYLPQGYYYNDGNKWVQITDTNIAAWRNIETQEAATSNNDNIYQTGAVVVGNADLDSHVQFSVISDSKGVLFPKLTTNDRSRIDTSTDEIPDGLIIYNIDTHCYNYYSKGAKEWISLCGSVDPAEFVLDDCPSARYDGTYKVGEALTTNHTYTIKVKVEKAGTYNIVVSTGNGYSFSKSGEFSEAGLSPTIVLEGQGVPIMEGTDNVTVRFNGQIVALPADCDLQPIPVAGNQAQYTMDCNSRKIHGEYQQGKLVSAASHYVDIDVTGLQTGDNAIIQAIPADESNGLLFRSDPVLITKEATTSVRLYASGTPSASGNFDYIIDSKPTGLPCTFTINVTNNIGTFDNPAKSCFEIYSQLKTDSSTPSDGEYWIQRRTGSRDAVKTFCDMTHGGYTLIWSYSEKTFRNNYGTPGYMAFTGHGYHISNNKPSGLITTDGEGIKYENFRLEFATMQNVKQNATKPSEYRVRIAYDPDDVNDAWGNENYFEVTPATINFDYIGTTRDAFTARGSEVATVGKLFGKDYVQNTNDLVTVFNGRRYVSFVYAYYGRTGYGNHWDAGHRMTGAFDAEVTKHDGNKKTIRVQPTTLNNIFGSIYEIDMNHHIGKCGDSEDDYGDADRYCDAYQRRPHSFHNGEGRYVQWYVK